MSDRPYDLGEIASGALQSARFVVVKVAELAPDKLMQSMRNDPIQDHTFSDVWKMVLEHRMFSERPAARKRGGRELAKVVLIHCWRRDSVCILRQPRGAYAGGYSANGGSDSVLSR